MHNIDKILTIKLISITVFIGITSYFYYDQHFIKNTQTLYHFNKVSFLIASISFGIIISASIYNLAFYFYIRNQQYLYYGLAQLSTLFFLITLDSIFISPFDEIFGITSSFLFDIFRASILLFSMLFIKEFLKTYQLINVQKLIQLILYLTIADFIFAFIFSFTILTNFIPIFILVWLVLSEASRSIKKKDMPFYFLLTGWYLVIFIASIEHIGFIEMIGVSFPFIHISFAIESIFISLAIAYKFKLIEERQKIQQSLLLQQSRLASMGEMLSIIAHQWRQPLNFLSLVNMNLKRMHKEDQQSNMLISESNKQIEYMSDTIESFRNFYNPSKNKELFSITNASKNVFEITKHALKIANIPIQLQIKEDFNMYGNKNEFEQVILNLINNAKDALIEKNTQYPLITVSIKNKNIQVKDNAGGIESKHLSKIFDPYFSTKKDSDGIGLYISKMIVEQEMSGKLTTFTDDKTTIFIIDFQ